MNETSVSWEDVWALYALGRDVFLRVLMGLRRKGWKIPHDVEHDLIHEFLIRRARAMLAKYAPERGTMDGLLAVAFRNFVISELRVHKHQEDLWASQLLREPSRVGNDLTRIEALLALSMASPEQLLALRALIDGGSLRAAARTLGLSRWETRKLLAETLRQLEAKHPEALFGFPKRPKLPD